ncbi:TRAP transporter substrate-binding protein [Salibacterium aidingense]|uniref:TRAP transporter substrate-binding protein n=1 Tax=Salibacterium aidingense TaxID=384933 RepID=UPI00040563A7|nr:TRAP transporter substrate-binding protein [Salibacterium aidingense]
MKRVGMFAVSAVLLLGLTACGEESSGGEKQEDGNGSSAEGETSAEAEYEITFGHVVSPNTAKGQAAEHFGELLEEKTGGHIEVEVLPDSQLGSDREIIEQMQSGTVEMNAPFTGVLPSFAPEYQVFDLPYLFEDKDHAFDAMHGELGEKLNGYIQEAGVKVLGYWDGGFKHFTNSERPIETPDDMNGLKMRASQSPLISAQFDALNAGGVSIDFSELYTSLQQGTVDGQENPLSNIVTQNFYEVQDYMTYSGHGYMGYVLMISDQFYQELPEELQQAVDEAAEETTEWQWEKAAEDEEEYRQVVEESDMEITELTEEQKQQFMEATEEVYDVYREEVEDADDIIELVE